MISTSCDLDMENIEENSAILPALGYSTARKCSAGEQLIQMGDDAKCFYFVEKGTFEVSYTAQKTPIVVALIGKGNFFGEIGYFDHKTRTRTIRATEPSTVRVFNKEVMQSILAENPALYACLLEFLLRSVSARFRKILTDQGPLTAYAASLSTGKEHFKSLMPIPPDVMGSNEWKGILNIVEGFKLKMFNLSYALQKDRSKEINIEQRKEGEGLLNDFKDQLFSFFYADVKDSSTADLMWGYVFKEVFPYFMRSRFAERAYYKPKGYAGDFSMIERIYQNRAEGDGKLGRMIDQWLLSQVAARAVRGRRRLLCHLLDQFCQERLGKRAPIHIMNLACGPSRELIDLFLTNDYHERINALCVDIDSEALQFAHHNFCDISHKANVQFMNENVIKWSLGRVKHDFVPQDIIYSSGLCDYLDRRLLSAFIQKCHQTLKKDGVLILGNFSSSNPERMFMDHVLYWRLIYRDRKDLKDVFFNSPFKEDVEIVAEEEEVNLFAIARRS